MIQRYWGTPGTLVIDLWDMNYKITKLNKIVYKLMRKHEINLYDHSESNSDKDSKMLEVEESSKSKIKT